MDDRLIVGTEGEANLASMSKSEIASYRHAHFYLGRLEALNNDYKQGGSVSAQVLIDFNEEWLQLNKGMRWTEAASTVHHDAQVLCSDYRLKGHHLLYLQQNPYDQIKSLQVALVSARQLGHTSSEGKHLNSLGVAYMQLGEFSEASNCFREAFVLAHRIGDQENKLNVLRNQALISAHLGDDSNALALYQQGLTLAQQINNYKAQVNILSVMGNIYRKLKNYEAASDCFDMAIALARRNHYQVGEAHVLGNRANALISLGHYERALEDLAKTLAVYRTIGDQREEVNALCVIGNVKRLLRNFEEAGELLNKGYKLAIERNHRIGQAAACLYLALLYQDTSHIEQALPLAEEACRQYEMMAMTPMYKQAADVVQKIRSHMMPRPRFSWWRLGRY